ncbi:MAG: acyl-CoA dehydrogenase family protein [Deltaproteobacteria bacterium]
MATALTDKLSALQHEVALFAHKHIASRNDLSTMSEFPWDIWRLMGDAGLLGLALPEEYGGRGGGYLSLSAAGEALVLAGGNLGLALSLCIHHLVARFLILGFGNPRQREAFVPPMASGRMTGCLAASEPEVGAHPKYLKTSASLHDDFYELNGEKTYLTDGPIADFFVVIAVTGVEDGRNRLTAFLVSKETPGLSHTDPMELDYLRPAPHGGIKLEQARVPASHILGREGRAYEEMLRHFRDIEDAVLMGSLAGAMARQIELAARLIKREARSIDAGLAEVFGRLKFLLDQTRINAYEVTRMLDTGAHEEFLSLLLASRDVIRRFQSVMQEIISDRGLTATPNLVRLTADMKLLIGVGKNVARRKQIKIGEDVLSE